jgi:hypothetical protein
MMPPSDLADESGKFGRGAGRTCFTDEEERGVTVFVGGEGTAEERSLLSLLATRLSRVIDGLVAWRVIDGLVAWAERPVAPEDDVTVTSCEERGFGGTSGTMCL